MRALWTSARNTRFTATAMPYLPNTVSMLTIRETLATEGFGKPVSRAGRWTFPGARAHLRLLASGTQTAAPRRLRFIASPCTITTGLPNPGPEPAGAGRSVHQISPCEITTRCAPEFAARPRIRRGPSFGRSPRTPGSWPPSPRPAHGAQDIPGALLRTTAGCAISLSVSPKAPPPRKFHQGSTQRFSHR